MNRKPLPRKNPPFALNYLAEFLLDEINRLNSRHAEFTNEKRNVLQEISGYLYAYIQLPEKVRRRKNFSRTSPTDTEMQWFKKRLRGLSEEDLKKAVRLSGLKSAKDKKELLQKFESAINERLYTLTPRFRTTKTEFVPMDTPSMWINAGFLYHAICSHPKRLKLCPYCSLFFWDAETKSGNREVCSNKQCINKHNAFKVRKSRIKKTKKER